MTRASTGMENYDMCGTTGKEVVCEKARAAHDPIKSHPLTPELSAKLFAQVLIDVACITS